MKQDLNVSCSSTTSIWDYHDTNIPDIPNKQHFRSLTEFPKYFKSDLILRTSDPIEYWLYLF